MKKSFIARTFKKLAKEVGVKVVLEDEFGFVGQVVLSNGRKRYFRNNFLDLNPLGASEIALDKDYAAYFMKKLGFPVVSSFKFYSDKWCAIINSKKNINAAYQKVKEIGFPVILKPNNASQGAGVTKVYNKKEFFCAAKEIFRFYKIMLVQKVFSGQDYRFVVLDNEVISAYERIPLKIIGDGKSTIKELIQEKQKLFLRTGRDTIIDDKDFRIAANLTRKKLTFKSIPIKNEVIFLLDNTNLSSGGEAIDVIDQVSEEFKNIAIRLTREMNLRYCGVDLMTTDPITSKKPRNYIILEINAAPGLDNYASSRSNKEQTLLNLYRKVLQAFKRD